MPLSAYSIWINEKLKEKVRFKDRKKCGFGQFKYAKQRLKKSYQDCRDHNVYNLVVRFVWISLLDLQKNPNRYY